MPRLLHIDETDRLVHDVPRHRHGAWVVLAYLEGRGEVVFDDRRVAFAPGTIVCVPPRTWFAERAAGGFRNLFLLADEVLASAAEPVVVADRARRPFHRLAATLLDERRAAASAPVQHALFEALLAWLREAARGREPADPCERLRRLIAAGVDQPGFALDAAIAGLPWSPAHLRRRFRERTGDTPREHLLRLRIERAKRLLRIGGFTVRQIAYAVGFDDPHYFSRRFRAAVGQPPGRFGAGIADPGPRPATPAARRARRG